MADWKRRASAGEWNEIHPWKLSNREITELKSFLACRLRKVEAGDGIETYVRHINTQESTSVEEADMASLYKSIHSLQSSGGPTECPFFDAVRYAIDTLMVNGVDYEGFRTTYLYHDSTSGESRQLDRDFAEAIIQKKRNFVSWMMEAPETESAERISEYFRWLGLYPWRQCDSLAHLFFWEKIREHTAFWHALNILSWYEGYPGMVRGNCLESMPGRKYSKTDRRNEVIDASIRGFEIGRSFDALLKKKFEPEIIVGRKNIDARRKAGRQRRLQTLPGTLLVVEKMTELTQAGHTISRAAELSAAQGIGVSREANRKLWYRNK